MANSLKNRVFAGLIVLGSFGQFVFLPYLVNKLGFLRIIYQQYCPQYPWVYMLLVVLVGTILAAIWLTSLLLVCYRASKIGVLHFPFKNFQDVKMFLFSGLSAKVSLAVLVILLVSALTDGLIQLTGTC